jgi:hypothetical protein
LLSMWEYYCNDFRKEKRIEAIHPINTVYT